MEQRTWTSTLSVGNEFLDSEHRKLLTMVGEVERTMLTKNVAALSQALGIFEDAVQTHFGNEAKIACAIDHPFEQHQREHEYVLNELQLMKNELTGPDCRWSESAAIHYLAFLSTWASEHIREDDMLMKSGLLTRPYDFRTDDLVTS